MNADTITLLTSELLRISTALLREAQKCDDKTAPLAELEHSTAVFELSASVSEAVSQYLIASRAR